MFNIMVGNTLYATATTTEVSVDSSTGSESSNGENLLETPEENTDSTTAAVDTTNAEAESTTADTTTTDATSVDGETTTADVEGETSTTDETNVEGETTDTNINEEESSDTTGVDTGVNEGEVIDASGDMSGMEGVDGMEGTDGMEGGIAATTTKDPFLSSYVPVVGITAATLVVGIIIGILLAKKKIKKGIDLYED